MHYCFLLALTTKLSYTRTYMYVLNDAALLQLFDGENEYWESVEGYQLQENPHAEFKMSISIFFISRNHNIRTAINNMCLLVNLHVIPYKIYKT